MTTIEEVWARFGGALLGFIRKRVGEAYAEDLFQEAMLRAHRGLPGLKDEARLKPWLYQIARNAVIDHARAARKDATAIPLPDDLPAPTEDEADLNVAMEACLAPILERIPQDYREAVRLADLAGVPQAEIARLLGLSPSGAKSRVQRGRRMVKEELEKCCRLILDGRGNVVECDPTGRGPKC